MKRKVCILFILACLCFFPAKVFADTMVPARLILEESGFTLIWNGQGIAATDGIKNVIIPLNNNVIRINETDVLVDQPAVIINNQMFISQQILGLLDIIPVQIPSQINPKLILAANSLTWDIRECTASTDYFAVYLEEGVHWLVPEMNQDLINETFNYFSYIYNQSNDNLRLAPNAYEELIMGLSNENSLISLPVEERLSKAVINFDASYAENTNNMNAVIALDYLNDKVVQPDQIFSFNKEVGPRTIDRGFHVGYSISGTKMVPDVGGGVCRASTILYNTVLDANLPVIERHPHSLPVTYVPKGRDATVAWNIYDFKFKNDLTHPIKISTIGSTTTHLVAEFWKTVPPVY